MKGFVKDIEKLTKANEDFRRVLYTGKHLQLVLMALNPGEEIGAEVHLDRDQFFRVEKGRGEAVIDGHRTRIKSDDAILVPAGARHNLINTGDTPYRSLDFQAMLRIGDHSLGPCLWTCDVCPQPQYLHQIHETTAAELLIRGAPLATLSCPPTPGEFYFGALGDRH